MLEKLRDIMSSTLNLSSSLLNEFDSRKMKQSDMEMADILSEDDFNSYISYREMIYDLDLDISEMNTLQRSLYCLLLAQAYVSGIIMLKYAQRFNKDNVIVESMKAGNASMGFDPARAMKSYITSFEEEAINYFDKSGYDYSYSASFDITFAGKDGFVDG